MRQFLENKFNTYILFILILSFHYLQAQKPIRLDKPTSKYGRIEGTIRDSMSTELLIGGNVVIVSTSFGACTDKNGFYEVHNIPSGIYTLKYSYIGYAPKLLENIEVLPSQTTRLDVYLLDIGTDWGLRDLANGNIRLIYGGQYFEPFPDSSFTDKYGFRYNVRGSGSVGEGEHNKIIETYLEKRNGEGWEHKVWVDWNLYQENLKHIWQNGVRWVCIINETKADTLIIYGGSYPPDYKYYHCEKNEWSSGKIDDKLDTLVLIEDNRAHREKETPDKSKMFACVNRYELLIAISNKNYILKRLTKLK